MGKVKVMWVLLLLLPVVFYGQDKGVYSKVKTATGEVKIPGQWEQLNTMDDSGQTYLTNKEGVVIAVAQNLKKSYSFFKSNASDFENVRLFYQWDSDWRKENSFKTDKLKEDATLEYVIWKYYDGKADNVFLFGSSKATFLNLLVYTDKWKEADKILFLENLYQLNK